MPCVKNFSSSTEDILKRNCVLKGKKKISVVLLIKSSSFIKKKKWLSSYPIHQPDVRENTKIYRAFPLAPVGAVMDLVDGFNFWVAWEFISFHLITVNLNSGSYSDRLF